jgi:hypothetical protein
MPRFWAMIRGDQFRVTRETGEQDTGFYVCRITEAADEQAAHSIIDIEEIETIPTGNDDFKETGFIFFNDQALPDQN